MKSRIDKKTALILYIVLGVVTVALLIVAVCASLAGKAALYPKTTAVIFIALAAALCVSVVAFNPRKSFYDLGFYILHAGIVIFIAGMAIFSLRGEVHNVILPDISSVTEAAEYQIKNTYGSGDAELERLRSYRNQIAGEEGKITDLGFNFRIVDFDIQYYENTDDVRHYEATLEFFLRDGTTQRLPLTVNHPLYRGGWKIYLMNVSENIPYGYEQVHLMIKKDPAEFLSVAGIILTIAGTFMMCFLSKGKYSFRSKGEKQEVRDNE